MPWEFDIDDNDSETQLDFTVGIEIKRTSDCQCILCMMGEGKYPYDFFWEGWHEECTCEPEPILKRPEEQEEDYEILKRGKIPHPLRSRNRVRDIPASFKDYVNSNRSLYNKREWFTKNIVYFYTEEEKVIDESSFDEDELQLIERYQKKGMEAAIRFYAHHKNIPKLFARIIVQEFIWGNKIPQR